MLTAAMAEVNGRQKLIKMDIEKLSQGETSHEVLFDFDTSSPESFVFSPDGKWLFGSSYYSGVSNIYRYDFAAKEMVAVTNAEAGFFRPAFFSDDSLIVLHYTGKGFQPVMIANQAQEQVSAANFLGQAIVEKHPIVKTWNAGSPAEINIDSLTTFAGAYSPLKNIRLNSIYPIVEGYKDLPALGLRFNLMDRIGFSRIDLTASYTPNRRLPEDVRVHLGLKFYHWQWQLSAAYNGADFYDLFGPTKISRKGYSVGIQHRKNLLYDEPKTLDLNLNVTGYGGLEKLPDFQNIHATFAELLSARAALNYQFVDKSLGAVDEEKGVKWQLVSQNNYVNGEVFPRLYTNFDYGILLPWNHSSVWLRNSLGYSFGDRQNPFANFFFGGFGNNWVDHLSVQRYREYYSFPGVELNAIGGKNYVKATLEWDLPPIRFRRVGFPDLYFRWARLALFSSGVVTNVDSRRFRRSVMNLGAQMDFNLVLLSNLASTFSLGYAVAVEKDQRLAKEFMISLKPLGK